MAQYPLKKKNNIISSALTCLRLHRLDFLQVRRFLRVVIKYTFLVFLTPSCLGGKRGKNCSEYMEKVQCPIS